MTHVLDAIVLVLFLIVGAWIVIFGTAGLVLARSARLSRSVALVICSITGPFGVGWLMWRGRGHHEAADAGTGTGKVVEQRSTSGDRIPGI